jgi:hypothetical protein
VALVVVEVQIQEFQALQEILQVHHHLKEMVAVLLPLVVLEVAVALVLVVAVEDLVLFQVLAVLVQQAVLLVLL